MKLLQRLLARLRAPTAPVAPAQPPSPEPEAPRQSIRISETALANSAEKPSKPVWEVARAAPGVLPTNHGMAMDSSVSGLYGFALQSMFSEGLAFPGYPYLSELTLRAEYRRPSETLAKEMTRKWIKIQSTGEDSDKSEKIKKIEAAFKRLNVRGVVKRAAELDGFFGRAQIYLDCGYGLEDRDEISKPLALTRSKIGVGSLKRLTVVEPLWTYPDLYNTTNPLAPDFYRPSGWFVMGARVHSSRLLTVIGRPLPDILKPAYAFGGLSLSQMAKPYVDNWLRTRQSVSDITHAFSVMVLKTNMGDVLTGGAGQVLANRARLFTQHRDNRGVFLIDKDTEEFDNVAAPIAGLDKLQSQSQEQMSAVTGIPLSILLGITPSGLNASNDGEIRTFYAWVEAQQESMLSPHVEHILKVVQLSEFGEIDPEITFMWEPLWAMSEKERGEVRKQEAETDQIYIDAGVLSPQESRTRLARQEDSPYASLDIDAVPIPPSDDDDDPLQDPPEGGPGHGDE
jgi:phage-related protein (TIGR01555 family)